jgi:hypothetical protein
VEEPPEPDPEPEEPLVVEVLEAGAVSCHEAGT